MRYLFVEIEESIIKAHLALRMKQKGINMLENLETRIVESSRFIDAHGTVENLCAKDINLNSDTSTAKYNIEDANCHQAIYDLAFVPDLFGEVNMKEAYRQVWYLAVNGFAPAIETVNNLEIWKIKYNCNISPYWMAKSKIVLNRCTKYRHICANIALCIYNNKMITKEQYMEGVSTELTEVETKTNIVKALAQPKIINNDKEELSNETSAYFFPDKVVKIPTKLFLNFIIAMNQLKSFMLKNHYIFIKDGYAILKKDNINITIYVGLFIPCDLRMVFTKEDVLFMSKVKELTCDTVSIYEDKLKFCIQYSSSNSENKSIIRLNQHYIDKDFFNTIYTAPKIFLPTTTINMKAENFNLLIEADKALKGTDKFINIDATNFKIKTFSAYDMNYLLLLQQPISDGTVQKEIPILVNNFFVQKSTLKNMMSLNIYKENNSVYLQYTVVKRQFEVVHTIQYN